MPSRAPPLQLSLASIRSAADERSRAPAALALSPCPPAAAAETPGPPQPPAPLAAPGFLCSAAARLPPRLPLQAGTATPVLTSAAGACASGVRELAGTGVAAADAAAPEGACGAFEASDATALLFPQHGSGFTSVMALPVPPAVPAAAGSKTPEYYIYAVPRDVSVPILLRPGSVLRCFDFVVHPLYRALSTYDAAAACKVMHDNMSLAVTARLYPPGHVVAEDGEASGVAAAATKKHLRTMRRQRRAADKASTSPLAPISLNSASAAPAFAASAPNEGGARVVLEAAGQPPLGVEVLAEAAADAARRSAMAALPSSGIELAIDLLADPAVHGNFVSATIPGAALAPPGAVVVIIWSYACSLSRHVVCVAAPGMQAPLRIAAVSPSAAAGSCPGACVISDAGLMYARCSPAGAGAVLAFDAAGRLVRGLAPASGPCAATGLVDVTALAVVSWCRADALLLVASGRGAGAGVTALDLSALAGAPAGAAAALCSARVLWHSAVGRLSEACTGLAVLPALGLVAAAVLGGSGGGALTLLRLADGVALHSTAVDCPGSVAVDLDTRVVYVSSAGAVRGFNLPPHLLTGEDGDVAVPSFEIVCEPTACGGGAAAPASGGISGGCHLAVVRPAPGKRVAHLIISCAACAPAPPVLRVLALPDHALVHEHCLEPGVLIGGLAADPIGSALAVCDASSGAILVLPWPLPGMAALD